MGVLDQLDVVYVERLEGPRTVRIFHRAGHRLPAHATSTGKVLLAHLPAEILQARLVDWQPGAPHPAHHHRPRVLLDQLGRVAERGWAQNVEEGALGAVSVASARARRHGCRHRGDQRGRAGSPGPPHAAAASCRGDRRRRASSPRGSATGRGRTGRPDAPVPSARGIGSAERNCPLYPPGAAGTIGCEPVESPVEARPESQLTAASSATRGTRRPRSSPVGGRRPVGAESGARHRPDRDVYLLKGARHGI